MGVDGLVLELEGPHQQMGFTVSSPPPPNTPPQSEPRHLLTQPCQVVYTDELPFTGPSPHDTDCVRRAR
jgi:hypothetical protein